LLTKAKLTVLSAQDKRTPLQHFTTLEMQGTPEQRAVARYGIGLVYLENQQYAAASEIFQKLSEQYPTQPQYMSALARAAMEGHDPEKAAKLYEKAINSFPSNDALKIEYTRSLIKSSQPQRAKQVLQGLSDREKDQPFYYELLAQIFAELKQPGESHRYMAEYYYASGETEAAIMQIRLAKQERDLSFQLQAILNERLNFFLSEEESRRAER
jgi:predicted Zn-dependent protease